MTASTAAMPFIPRLYPAVPPANPTPSPPAPAPTSLSRAGAIAEVQPRPRASHLAAHAVSSQFATRPDVRSVVRDMLGEAINSADPAVAKRAFDAMMRMRKIDVAAIEAACRG